MYIAYIYTLYIISDIETYVCRFFDLSSLGYIFGSFGDFCGALNVKEMGDSTPKKSEVTPATGHRLTLGF